MTKLNDNFVVKFYYKAIPGSIICNYPHTNLDQSVPLYSDIECKTEIGFLYIKSNLQIRPEINQIQEKNPFHSNQLSLTLNNGDTIEYSYTSEGIKEVKPFIGFTSGVFSSVKSMIRIFIDDNIREIQFIF